MTGSFQEMREWKRSERAMCYKHFAEASESDNKEADHKRVNCVGLFPLGTGKDWMFANMPQSWKVVA